MLHRVWFGDDANTLTPIVLLHEGLGSVSSWGSFPERLADELGRRVMAYDRLGYGASPAKPGPWGADFMHREAAALADLLRSEGLGDVILVGHSDGGSISLLYSAVNIGDVVPDVTGIVSISAHTFLEPVTVTAIQRLRAGFADGLRKGLARHHADVDATFDAWSGVWVSDRFSTWAIDDELSAVECPVLAIQGADDSYGSWQQVERLADGVTGPTTMVELDGVDHWPHREATNDVVREIRLFLATHDL